MTNPASKTNCAALIGDVLSSRNAPNQNALFAALFAALEWVNSRVGALQPLQITVGDEFQAVYRSYLEAAQASLLLALKLGDEIELRFGLGWGEVSAYDVGRLPYGQSGTAWWHARQAIEEVEKAVERQQWPRSLRLQALGFAESTLLNSFFICRDELLANMDARDRRIALGLLTGEKQADIARALGISQPSVAKRQKSKGINALFRAQEQLNAAQILETL